MQQKIHNKQAEAVFDKTRFKFWLAGRRGGKTVGVREDILRHIPSMPDNAGILYCAPTNQLAKELIWNELDDRITELNWKCKPMVSTQRFEFSRGRYIQVLGAEKIRRVRGKKFYRAYLDEIAFYSSDLGEVWRAVRPTLSDYQGGCIVSTTPNGKGTQAYDFYLQIQAKTEWKYFHWKTIDNPFIDPQEIEAARNEMDEKSFKQEYEAAWESFEGLVYYGFDENLHIKKQPPIAPELPMEISFDFNVNPTTLLLLQDTRDKKRLKKEYSLKNASTPDTVKRFCEDYKHLAGSTPVYYYGDSTGSARESTTAKSDYYFVEEVLKSYGFQFQRRVPGVNPGILDRVAYMNGALKNVNGQSTIEIDPSCTETIRDLGSQEIDGRLPSAKNNLGHKADALGYYIFWKHIVEKRGVSRMIQL